VTFQSSAQQPAVENGEDTALAHQNVGLFAKPEIREPIRGATGLSGASLDRVSEGLAKLGVALLLPNGADLHAKYANAINLVRHHEYSVIESSENSRH